MLYALCQWFLDLDQGPRSSDFKGSVNRRADRKNLTNFLLLWIVMAC